MDEALLKSIINHIYSNLLLIPSNFIDPTYNISMLNKEFVLDKKLLFEDEDLVTRSNNIWGCQMSVQNKTIKILCGDCYVGERDIKEYAVIVSYTDSPSYGIYCSFSEDYVANQDALIAVSTNGFDWMKCNTFLQASFLAAMEQLKDFGLPWQKCEDYKQELNNLKSFINYHESLFQ